MLQLQKIRILEIDIQGAKAIRARQRDLKIYPRYIFIAPPNLQQLEERLRYRGSENENEIQFFIESSILYPLSQIRKKTNEFCIVISIV